MTYNSSPSGLVSKKQKARKPPMPKAKKMATGGKKTRRK